MRAVVVRSPASFQVRLVCLSLLWTLVSVCPASAQRGFGQLGGTEPAGQYPSPQYYVGLEVYRTGDLEAAMDVFDAALRTSRRDINGRWIDAIPALTMLAECYWHLGDLSTARQHLDHVFQIAIRNRGWLGRIDWQSALQPGLELARPTGLWPEASAVRLVPVADKIMYSSGKPLTARDVAAGGSIEELNLRTIDSVEIMRCLALASYRRRIILGPLAQQDPMASTLLEATKYPAGLQIPIARSLIGSLRMAGYFSSAEDKRAIEGAPATVFSGGVHPLSAIGALAQASAMAGTGEPDATVVLALNLIHSAAALEQPELIGEGLQIAAGCASSKQASLVRQAATTVATSMLRKSRLATLHSLIAGADAAITAGDLDSATTMISQAQSLASRRDVAQPRLEAYGAYVAARLAAASGSPIGVDQKTPLDEALGRMTSFALNHRIRKRALVSMPRVYQLALIGQAIGNSLGGNTSDKLLLEYCRDPSPEVWRRDAVDALAGAMVDRSSAHLARVNLAASAGYGEKLLQAIDLMLAARFTQRLPLGGRIAQVRTIARADDQMLEKDVAEFRKNAGPALAAVRAAAAAMGEPNAIKVETLEAQASGVALSRISLPQVMPPQLDEKLPVARLPKRTGLLTFTVVGNKLLATLSAEGKVVMWTVAGGNRLPSEIGRLLKAIGVGKTRGSRLPEDESWKETAITIRRQLLPDDATISADRFDELIVVPDGPLWYLPLEILPVGDVSSALMADQMTIRYAATPGLALKSVGASPVSRAVGVSADLFFAPRDPETNEAIVQSLIDVIDEPVRLPQTIDLPTGLLGNRLGHLVVAAPRAPDQNDYLRTHLAPYDQGSPYGSLAGWMRFPAEVASNVVLFGYRTPVGVGQLGTGDELFTTLCALHAAGVRSVMLSRWAVGGESSAIALRELLQELPFAGMSQSWNRARTILRRTELDPVAEPLLPKADHEREGLTGDQPLFWAGYLVSSPGLQPTAKSPTKPSND